MPEDNPHQPYHMDTSNFETMVPNDPNATIMRLDSIGPVSFLSLSDVDETFDSTQSGIFDSDELPDCLRENKDFAFIKIVGEGGFGEVWKGTQNNFSRTIAIKRLKESIYEETRSDLTIQRFYEENFLRESIATAHLEHPNIVPVYDFGLDKNNRPLLAMKLVKGRPWNELIKESRRLPKDEFLAQHLPILIDVCQAVEFAHSRGIIHRDLKPSQVMVGEFSENLLMDWGLALAFDEEKAPTFQGPENSSTKLSTRESSGNPAGTIAFMAPEQTRDHGGDLGPWTDIYLLGGVLYFLLTGYPPHPSPDSSAAFLHAKMGFVDEPQKLVKSSVLSPDLCHLAMQAMEAEIDERVKTVQEFREGLETYLSEADKRIQSRKLIEDASKTTGSDQQSYSDMGARVNMVERAAALWPNNPDVFPLKKHLLISYATIAMKNNDLAMAKAQASQIVSCEEKTALLAQILAEERTNRIHSLSSRIFMIGTIIALVAVSILTVWLNQSQEAALEAQAETETKAYETLQVQKNSEELLFFIIDDLSSELSHMQRLDLLDDSATRATQYYNEIKEMGGLQLSPAELTKRAELFSIIGNIRLGQGRLQEAHLAFLEAAEIYYAQLESTNPATEVFLKCADNDYLLASSCILRQDFESGVKILDRAKETLEQLEEPGELNPDDQVSMKMIRSNLLLIESSIAYAKGEKNEALSAQNQSVNLLNDLNSEKLQDEIEQHLINALIQHSFLASQFNELAIAEESIRKAESMLQRLISVTSTNLNTDYLSAQIDQQKSINMIYYGNYLDAIEILNLSHETAYHLIRQDENNIRWKELAAMNEYNLARAECGAGNYHGSINSANNALDLFQIILEHEPENIRRKTQIAMTLQVLAESEYHDQKFESAKAALNESSVILSTLISSNNEFAIWKVQNIRGLYLQSLASMGSGQPALERTLLDSVKDEVNSLNGIAENYTIMKPIIGALNKK